MIKEDSTVPEDSGFVVTKLMYRGKEKWFSRPVTVKDVTLWAQSLGVFGTFYLWQNGECIKRMPASGIILIRGPS